MKTYSVPLVIRKKQIKTTMRHHVTPAVIKKTHNDVSVKMRKNRNSRKLLTGLQNHAGVLENRLAVPQKVKPAVTI